TIPSGRCMRRRSWVATATLKCGLRNTAGGWTSGRTISQASASRDKDTGTHMTGILAGLRIVEGSAFIAAPLGGMTLAQLGADVIRFDDIQGGLDSDRWPVTRDGGSIYWAGLNKGKRSIAVDLRSPRGRELLTALITAPGADAGIFT